MKLFASAFVLLTLAISMTGCGPAASPPAAAPSAPAASTPAPEAGEAAPAAEEKKEEGAH